MHHTLAAHGAFLQFVSLHLITVRITRSNIVFRIDHR